MKALIMAVAAAAVLMPSAVLAGDQDFTLVNKTGFDINEVYVSPSKRQVWGNDVLGTGMLHNGNQVSIKFKPSNQNCIYDLRVVYTDGDDAEWEQFDLCTISKIRITYDPKTHEPTAEYE
jgi:hypothetical protein